MAERIDSDGTQVQGTPTKIERQDSLVDRCTWAIGESGAYRLQLECQPSEASQARRTPQPPQGEICPSTPDELVRATDNDVPDIDSDDLIGTSLHSAQEEANDLLDFHRLAIDGGLVKSLLGHDRLDGLQKALAGEFIGTVVDGCLATDGRMP